jgi:octaprenyl-diphosphate synthase
MTIAAIQTLLQNELQQVNDLIIKRLHSKIDLVNLVAEHIVNSGGKRTRPMLLLLAANALHTKHDAAIELAAIIEFIHTATLLHDDVVDGSLLRRGIDTANAVYGPAPSVLVGDFLYSRSFQMMVQLQNMQVMEILANTTNTISEGEVLQLMNAGNPDTTEAQYLDVIRCKTAELFKAATELGAVATQASPEIQQAMANYGLHLGMAYQIADDILDYQSDADTMGKNVGDDLAEGKPTLPLIYIMQNGNHEQQQLVRNAIEVKSAANLTQIQQAIADTHALDYCRAFAKREAETAINELSNLPHSDYQQAMIDLANFAFQRTY